MMRKVAREAVIFMLIAASLSMILTITYQVVQRRHVRATTPNIDLSAGLVPKATIWIMVDPYQQYGGKLVGAIEVPPQIDRMLNAKTACVAGSETYSTNGTEWVCVADNSRAKDQQGAFPAESILEPADYLPHVPAGYTLEQPGATNVEIATITGFAGLLGLPAGLILWILYRTILFAVKG
jgi:hypothetical protein